MKTTQPKFEAVQGHVGRIARFTRNLRPHDYARLRTYTNALLRELEK